MPTWPSSLPKFSLDGYQRKPAPAGSRFEPDLGPALQRRRTRAAPWRAQYALKLTASQLAVFWAFWRDECQSGALEFQLDDPIDGVARSFRFVVGDEPEEGVEGRWHTILFRGEWAAVMRIYVVGWDEGDEMGWDDGDLVGW